MTNQGTLIGRYVAAINDGIVIKVTDPRTQDVPVILRGQLKENVDKYLQEDALVGIRFKLEMDDNFNVQVVADKVTFMSSETAGKVLGGGEEDGRV